MHIYAAQGFNNSILFNLFINYFITRHKKSLRSVLLRMTRVKYSFKFVKSVYQQIYILHKYMKKENKKLFAAFLVYYYCMFAEYYDFIY